MTDAEIEAFNLQKIHAQQHELLLKKLNTESVPLPALSDGSKVLFLGYANTLRSAETNRFFDIFETSLAQKHRNTSVQTLIIPHDNPAHLLYHLQASDGVLRDLSPSHVIVLVGPEIIPTSPSTPSPSSSSDGSESSIFVHRRFIEEVVAHFLRPRTQTRQQQPNPPQQPCQLVLSHVFLVETTDTATIPIDNLYEHFDEWRSQLQRIAREYRVAYLDLDSSFLRLQRQLSPPPSSLAIGHAGVEQKEEGMLSLEEEKQRLLWTHEGQVLNARAHRILAQQLVSAFQLPSSTSASSTSSSTGQQAVDHGTRSDVGDDLQSLLAQRRQQRRRQIELTRQLRFFQTPASSPEPPLHAHAHAHAHRTEDKTIGTEEQERQQQAAVEVAAEEEVDDMYLEI